MTEDKQMAQLISKVHEVWNSPKNKANHKHWLVYSYLELDELISLSYDREPTHWTDTFDALEKYSDIARDFCHRRELIRRAIKVGDLQEPVRPKAFTKWVKENKLFDLSEQFCNAAERKKKPDDELGARERDSLFTILACLAYHHGFDPRRSPWLCLGRDPPQTLHPLQRLKTRTGC